MLTEQQIEQATDQELADLAAVHCMGWKKTDTKPYSKGCTAVQFWLCNGETVCLEDDWQPHQPTEKGKAQAIDLADKLGLSVSFAPDDGLNFINGFDSNGNWIEVADNSWQVAVLRACLLSEVNE